MMQLTSVAKTVLGLMKLGSQDGGKAKESSKTNEDKRATTLGKSEASSGSRHGLTELGLVLDHQSPKRHRRALPSILNILNRNILFGTLNGMRSL